MPPGADRAAELSVAVLCSPLVRTKKGPAGDAEPSWQRDGRCAVSVRALYRIWTVAFAKTHERKRWPGSRLRPDPTCGGAAVELPTPSEADLGNAVCWRRSLSQRQGCARWASRQSPALVGALRVDRLGDYAGEFGEPLRSHELHGNLHWVGDRGDHAEFFD